VTHKVDLVLDPSGWLDRRGEIETGKSVVRYIEVTEARKEKNGLWKVGEVVSTDRTNFMSLCPGRPQVDYSR
jgi:hypothetical protein